MEITKREVLLSVAIICMFIILGIVISAGINNSYHDAIQKYELALKIDDEPGLFQYAIRSHVGDVFASGTYSTIDPVSFEGFEGAYLEIEKVKEVYTKHTRTVTKTRTVNGKTQTYTDVETYWSWDRSWSKTLRAQSIEFLGVEIECKGVDIGQLHYTDTVYSSLHVRYKYYTIPESEFGTLYTNTSDGVINFGRFYIGEGIESTIENLKSVNPVIIFWVLWMVLLALAVVAFYGFENNWLESDFRGVK